MKLFVGDCLLQYLKMLPHMSTVSRTKYRVHLQFCAGATERTGGEEFCPPPLETFVQIVNGTQVLLIQWMPNCILRKTCFICDLRSANQWIRVWSFYLFIVHIASAAVKLCSWHESTSFTQIAVNLCKHMFSGFPPFWNLTLVFLR